MIVNRIIYKSLNGLDPEDLGNIGVGHDTYYLALRSQTSHNKVKAGGRSPVFRDKHRTIYYLLYQSFLEYLANRIKH